MTDNPTPNIPLLRKAVEWVEEQAALPAEERQWDQRVYRAPGIYVGRDCETAMCVAGYVADLVGTRWHSMDSGGDYSADQKHASDIAERELGLTSTQARNLFSLLNNAADIRYIAEQIAGEPL